MKKLWNFITTLLVAAAVVLAVALAGVRLAGIQVYTVLSGSMDIKTPRLIQFNFSSTNFAA